MWTLTEKYGQIKFLKVLHITFLWRSCKSVEKTKVLGCEDQPTEARGDNSQAVQCTCNTDRCNSWEPESIQLVNPRTIPYGPPTQSEIISPTPSSNSMPSISNTNGISTQIKFDMGLKTRPTVTTAATKMINGSHESKAKRGNIEAARQGSNGNMLLPHYFLVYFSTISIIQFCILQWACVHNTSQMGCHYKCEHSDKNLNTIVRPPDVYKSSVSPHLNFTLLWGNLLYS